MLFTLSKVPISCRNPVGRLCIKRFFSAMNAKYPGQLIEVNGVNIHYEKVGQGNVPVILLPGALGSTRTDFSAQLEKLNRDKFTVVAWDPPGYGYSRPPDKKYTLDFLHKDADLVVDLMKKLGFQNFSALGWSDGGITGLLTAIRHPSSVNKLVVWGANAYITAEDLKLYHAVRDVTSWSERMRAPMEAIYGADYFRQTWAQWVDTFDAIYKQKGGDLCKEGVKSISCPTLIVHGEKDPMVPGEHPQYLLDSISDSRLHTMKEGKHNIHLRYADDFNKLVEKFLTQK